MTNKEIAQKNFTRGLWTVEMLNSLVQKEKLSKAEFEEITGQAYTGPEPPLPGPVVETRLSALEAENARLKAQNEMQAQQQTFLEDCLLEMGNIVYA